MTARRADIADLPNWPLYLSREQAAAFVGVAVATFEKEVEQGLWPQSVRRGPAGGRVLWFRPALEARAHARDGEHVDDDSLEGWRAKRAARQDRHQA